METINSSSPSKASFLLVGAILISVAGGALIGATTALVGSFLYIVFLFPVGMGFAGGRTVTAAVRLGKIRKNTPLVILSLLAAITIYGTYHYGRYVSLQAQTFLELSSRPTEETGPIGLEDAKFVLDYALLQETEHSGFVGYMLYKAQQGVSLSRLVSGSGTNLGPFLSWIYWLLEFGMIWWVIIVMGKKETQIPVCEVCGSRYGKEKHLGGTSIDNKSTLLDLIGRRDFVEVSKLLEENADLPSIELYIKSCTSCEKGISHLTVQQATQGSRGSVQFSNVSKVTLQPRDRMAFSH